MKGPNSSEKNMSKRSGVKINPKIPLGIELVQK